MPTWDPHYFNSRRSSFPWTSCTASTGASHEADCCKMKEAMNAITRADAPHSAIAKLRRDMDFNIMSHGRHGCDMR